MQANPGAMAAAIESIRHWTPSGSKVVDLHAGVGTIALCLADTQQLEALRLVEINPSSERAFWKSWNRLRESKGCAGGRKGVLPSEVQYDVGAAGSAPEQWLGGATVAIVDPPRKGLEKTLLEYLCSLGKEKGGGGGGNTGSLKRLIYMSCGWAALERDCSALLDSGAWELAAAEVFLFFPGADHIETLVVLNRLPA